MSGTGYNDPSKMAAAQELARMFKSGGNSDLKDKKGGGKRVGNSSAFVERQDPFHYSPPPPIVSCASNVPPPSQRHYTNTLASATLQRGPGSLLGSSPIDFLSRRESSSTPTPAGLSRETLKNPQPMSTVAPVVPDNRENSVHGNGKKPEVQMRTIVSAGPVRGCGGSSLSNGSQMAKGMVAEQGQSTARTLMRPTPAQAQPSSPLINLNSPTSASIANTFFSLMSEDSDEEANGQPETPQAKTTNNNTAPNTYTQCEDDLITISPETKPNVLSHKNTTKPLFDPAGLQNAAATRGPLSNITLSSQQRARALAHGGSPTKQSSCRLAALENQTGGKPEPLAPNKIPKLRPQAPRFTPKSRLVSIASSETSIESVESTHLMNSSFPRLCAETPEWVPPQQNQIQQIVAESLNCGPLVAGHIITVTPIQFADGCVFTGPSNGQLFVQSQVGTFNQPQTSLMQLPSMPNTGSLNLPARNAENIAPAMVQKPANMSRRVTKGLSSSMWST
ncbi:hypothetical protein FZEAL_5231 [Fusarium zealandicum]|uniref:Uncharacterized protein n=1 Tax=Fusarium zealandicum TaxID=1053134 RepID=A0A8H4UK48_9HYPO|nr:hypothetical protein FZEAL_5231 [Fusarium zealandicum]